MSDRKYTEGRLVVDFDNTYEGIPHYMVGSPDSKTAVALTGKVGAGDDEESKANAERIAACWNACQSFTTDELEYGLPEKHAEAELMWERLMMQLVGEDGPKSVTEAINKIKAERDELRTRLMALEDIATAVEADIDAGRPLEYNVDELRVELIRARKALGILPEQEQTTTLGMEVEEK